MMSAAAGPDYGPHPVSWLEHWHRHAAELEGRPQQRYVLNEAWNPEHLYCLECNARVCRPVGSADEQRVADYAHQRRHEHIAAQDAAWRVRSAEIARTRW